MTQPEISLHVFLGVRPSAAVTTALADVAASLARRTEQAGRAIAWVPPSAYHLSLGYAGWVRPEVLPALIDVADDLRAQLPQRVGVRGVVASPSGGDAKIIWAPMATGLAAWQKAAEAAQARLADLGCRSLGDAAAQAVPHITLGRLEVASAIGDVLLPYSEQVFSDWEIDTLLVIQADVINGQFSLKNVASRVVSSPQSAFRRQTNSLEPNAQETAQRTSPLDRIETDDGWPRGQGPSFEPS